MTFAEVLRELVVQTDGAIAAILLDREGETVQVIGEDFLRDELKIIGAYHGIFVAEAKKICSEMNHGNLQRLKVDWRGSTMLDRILPDGYFLVVILCSGSNEAMAWEEMEHYSEKIRREMG